MSEQRCSNCHHLALFVFIHSHYQCPVCGKNMLPCCEGETMQEEGEIPLQQATAGTEPENLLQDN